jgi:hypothetical protein
MKQIKKFRKNNWSDEEVVVQERRNHKAKKFDRALRIRDIDYLSDYDED